MVKKLGLSVLLLAVMGNFAWTSSARGNFQGNLTVEIDGLRNTEGQVCVSIFANSQGFPNNSDRVLKRQCTKITDTSLKVTFDNLDAGSYAVALIHDQNKDQILNRNNLGMPLEGFGFSRNPEVRTSPPKFSNAAFLLAGPNTVVQIQLKYL
ncbi:DUF2141 domain-containing protein [Nodularia spumigena]|uniref:DUF2141 domain-containing protein n=1 Tax=Nodularia spumigena TaxID=70799 RepID=UPI00232BE73F|nr:DUF2141 domain-containing protein [Nodularia spumigena]MDB9305386.1 DUF2141 domain-containing protein [Nodularia spumigena CS-591/12]MDB9317556.1 DUF2141 domain-containing protein [Nodularia spumigena CS-590/01A]MDB9323347.1 DUF2141 domain-containing protein [Nodularia spumigena CS-591/07A]MDB9328210.1 DUF2141 domain-containing protein [Nodularia spumigena CS-590/02]MDB9332115.1 DUF2141 domain-containing protein [Nodularia spumigena CS-591/04]